MTDETANKGPYDLCKRIRATRRQLELSQLEVALHIGISQSQYSLFEQGYVHLAPDVLQRIWGFLNPEPVEEASGV